jgi:hypothetical protein
LETEAVSIVFDSTDKSAKYENQDIITDVKVLSDLTTAQITAAKESYHQMNEKYNSVGGVTSVAENFLGGGLAGTVTVMKN